MSLRPGGIHSETKEKKRKTKKERRKKRKGGKEEGRKGMRKYLIFQRKINEM